MKNTNKLRDSGIDTVGSVSWGTHFCQFYQTKKDLLDILVPYFKAGLESGEFCVWVTSEFLTTKEATAAMRKAVPGFDKFLKAGTVEIFPHTEWYLKGGKFEMKRVLADWVDKHKYALESGYTGIRVSGNPFWIDSKKDWSDFAKYEAEINRVVNGYKMLVLCTYSLEKCGAQEVIDVVANHEFALIKRGGKWENIETVGQKKFEQSLRLTEERIKHFIKLSGHVWWTTNARGEVAEDVPTWRQFTGQSYAEIQGPGWAKALHPDDRKQAIKTWEQALTTKTTYSTEFRVRRHDGVYRHFMVKGIPIQKENGEVLEWVGNCIDITERIKIAEEAARKAAELEILNSSLQNELVKEEAMLKNLGEGVLAVDKGGKIIVLNQKASEIFGWKENQMVGKKLKYKFNLADMQGKLLPEDLRPIRLALVTGRVIEGEYLYLKGRGKTVPLFITSSPIIIRNSIQGAISVYRDISQQIAIDKAKDTFVSIASHELRTPLSAISWSLEHLLEDSKNLSTMQRKSVDQISRQTDRMITLTNDLLDATKMDLGLFSYKFEETNPLDIAAEVTENLKFQLKEKKIRFKMFLDKEIGSYRAYSNAIRIVLQNLLSNAVKFTNAGGRVALKIFRTEKDLIIQVADTGLGIPKSDLNRIFQKMYRGGNVKGRVEGTGLGLYIAKALVDYMGGKITVTSKQNEGTVFIVTLPFKKEAEKKKSLFDGMNQISLSL